MNIALLFGGQSFEHEVSLLSATYILRELAALAHTVYPIAIHKTGTWILTDIQQQLQRTTDNLPLIVPDVSEDTPHTQHVWTIPSDGLWHNRTHPTKLNVDCVFLVVHGYSGEDGKLQGLLSIADVPFTGCGCTTSALGMNKHIIKSVLHCYGLPVVPWVSFSQSEYHTRKDALIASCTELGFPLLIKPADGGSTIGVNKAHSIEELYTSIATCFQYTHIALVEQYLHPVREIEMAVMQRNTSIATFPPGEIITPKNTIYDYTLKYSPSSTSTGLEIPAHLPSSLVKEITELSKKVWTLLHCEGYARLDFFLTQNNTVYINEINTIPGFTQNSMFPRLAMQELSTKEIIQSIIDASITSYTQDALIRKQMQRSTSQEHE